MIIGLGSDLCNIERIQGRSTGMASGSSNACFTEVERAKAARRPITTAGTLCQTLRRQGGLLQGGRHRLFARRVHEGHRRGQRPSGAPTLALTGGAAARLDAMTPAGHRGAFI
jgi:holo-[acyl-carrier protein] synthase